MSSVALDDIGEGRNNACGGGGGADAGSFGGRKPVGTGVMGWGGGAVVAVDGVAAVAGEAVEGGANLPPFSRLTAVDGFFFTGRPRCAGWMIQKEGGMK